MRVRAAVLEDAEAISAIATDYLPMTCEADTPVEELVRYVDDYLSPSCFRSALTSPTQEVLVLEKNGQVVGFSQIDHTPDSLDIAQADLIPELKRCYVAASHRGTGAAQWLLAATLSGVAGRIRLRVDDENVRAISFYKRNGFESVGETAFEYGENHQRHLVMVREWNART